MAPLPPGKKRNKNRGKKRKPNAAKNDANSTEVQQSESSEYDESPERKRKSNSQISGQVKDPATKSKKIPPIIVPDNSIEAVFNIVGKLNIIDFRLQKISIGVKIILDTENDYNKLKNFLKENGISFYTFDLPEEKTTKIVIYGISFIPLESILSDLESKGAKPLHARIITPKANPANALPVLTFRKNSDEFKNFKALKDICKIIFSWKPYVNKEKSIIQCHNCQMMGHGSKNCNCTSKCVRCGDPHKSAECPLKDPDTNKIQETSVKCANCGLNHTANFSECPKRLEFINTQRSIQARNSQKLKSNSLSQPPIQNRLFSDVIKESNAKQSASSSSNIQVSSQKVSFLSQKVRPTTNPNLFSHSEIMIIFNELIKRLYSCTNKTEQLQVIIEVTSKYVFPDLDDDTF